MIFFETCTIDAKYGIFHCEVPEYEVPPYIKQCSPSVQMHSGFCSLQQPRPQSHLTTAMRGAATVLLKHKLNHLPSGTYHTALVKDMTEGVGFRGQGVRSNLRSAIQVFKSFISHANYSCPGTSLQKA